MHNLKHSRVVRSSIAALFYCVLIYTSLPQPTQAQAELGGEETDSCGVVTLIHGDEALTFVPVRNSRSTSYARSGSAEAGFAHESKARSARLPQPGQSLAAVIDPDCDCLNEVTLEVHMQVPHSTAAATTLELRDSKDRVVVSVEIPPEQQVRYSLDTADGAPRTLMNRIMVPLAGTQAPRYSLADIQYVRLYRSGDKSLTNIAPKNRPFVYWVISTLRLRRACKDCGSIPDEHGHQNAVVPLMEHDAHVTLLSEFTTLTQRPLDLRPMIDPLCRCLAGGPQADTSPTLHLDVRLHHRNVYPRTLRLQDSATGATLWEEALPRADADSVGTWQKLVARLPGRGNSAFQIGATGDGHDGPLPSWGAVTVSLERKALEGMPSAADVPEVRNAVLLSAASKLGDSYITYVRPGIASTDTTATLAPPVSLELRAGVETRHLSNFTQLSLAFRDFAAVLGADALGSVTTGFCGANHELCGGAIVAVDITTTQPGTAEGPALAVGVLHLFDKNQQIANVTVPSSAVASQRAAATGSPVDVWLPLRGDTVDAPQDFAWDAVVSVAATRAGPPALSPFDAAAAGTMVLSNVRIGVPHRVGYVSLQETYDTDDRACDPLTGWFDEGPFVRSDVVRYGHCRSCCCWFDDPGNPTMRHCYDQADIISEVTPAPDMAPNDQCAVCNRAVNPQVMTSRNFLTEFLEAVNGPLVAPCDDGNDCSGNDRCTDEGACIGDEYVSCLIAEFWGGDPSKDCEVCDGTGENSPTRGCAERPGHAVYNAGFANRTCGCRIDGVLWPHGAVNPRLPCTHCDATADPLAWSNRPNDILCNITDQFDWANLASQACASNFHCVEGVCTGTGYSCPPIQACEAPVDAFPHVCDLSGPDSPTGGCQRRTLPEGTVCAPQVHGCMPQSECSGLAGSCPPQHVLPGIIYEDSDKALVPQLPDGTPVDSALPVLPQTDTLVVTYESFRVQCGELQLRMAVIPPGDCAVDRVSNDLSDGWGEGSFEAPPRGSFSVRAGATTLGYVHGATTLQALDNGAVAGDGSDATLLALDTGAGDYTPPSPDSPYRDVPEPMLDVLIMRHQLGQVATVQLVDAAGRTVDFELPSVGAVVGVWSIASGPGQQNDNSGGAFDWASVVGVRVHRSGGSTVDGMRDGEPLFTIKALRLRTRAQGPPCAVADLISTSASQSDADVDYELELVYNASATAALAAAGLDSLAAFTTVLPTAADVSRMYDSDQNAFVDGAYLVLDIAAPRAGFAPTEVALTNTNGEAALVAGLGGVVSPAAPGDGATAWQRVAIALRPALLAPTVVDDATFQAVQGMELRFPVHLLDDLQAAGVSVPSARVRKPRIVAGKRCAHMLESASHGAGDLFVASSLAAALTLVPMAGVTTLRATVTAGADIGSDAFDLGAPLSELYDSTCTCFPDAVLELELATDTTAMRIVRVDIVEVATGNGVQLRNVAPMSAAPLSTGHSTRRGVLSIPLKGDHVTVVGPPSSWDSVNVMRFWRSGTASTEADAALSAASIEVHAVRVRRSTAAPCITTTTMLGTEFQEPGSARASSVAQESVLALGGDGLVRVPDVEAGSRQQEPDSLAFAATTHAGAWVEGGGGDDVTAAGGAHYTGVAVLPSAQGTATASGASVVVAVGSHASTDTSPHFAGTALPVTPTDTTSGVVAARHASSGLPTWAYALGTGVEALAAASAPRSTAMVGRGSHVAVVVGRVLDTVAGATTVVAGESSVTVANGGASDAFVAVIDGDTGSLAADVAAGTGLAVLGSAGADAWTAAAASDVTGALVLGGYTTGWPRLALGLSAANDAAGASAQSALVALYASAAAAVAPDGVANAPEWAQVVGHHRDAVSATVQSVVIVGELVLVAGSYGEGRLWFSADIELAAPTQASQPFVAAFAASDGTVQWAKALPTSTAAEATALTPLPAQGLAALCSAASDGSSTTLMAISAASGATQWQATLQGAGCTGLAVTGAQALAMAGTVPASMDGVAAAAWVTAPNPRHGLDAGAQPTLQSSITASALGSQGLLAIFSSSTGAFLSAERFGGDASMSSTTLGVSAAAIASDGSTMLHIVGSTVGPAGFGSPRTALFHSSADSEATWALPADQQPMRALLARFRDTVATGPAPTVMSRTRYERAAAIAPHQHGFAVATTITSTAVGVALTSADTELLQRGDQLGVLRFMSRGWPEAVSTTVLGSEWGVTGASQWAATTVVPLPSYSSVILAVGHVDGVAAGYVTVPGTGTIERLAFPDSQEPLVVAFDTDGSPQWALSSALAGSTSGDDSVADLAFDARSSQAVVVGSALDTRGVLVNCGAEQGVTCSVARATAFTLGTSASKPPTGATTTAFFRGDGLSSTATAVSSAEGLVALGGDFHIAASLQAPAYMRTGDLHVPGSLQAGDGTTDSESATVTAPADGSRAGWVAAYGLDGAGASSLLWAAALHGSAGEGVSAAVSLASVAVGTAHVFVCGTLDLSSSGDSSSSSTAAAIQVATSGSAMSSHAWSGAEATSKLGFAVALDSRDGTVAWLQWASTDSLSGASCDAVVALGSQRVALVGSVHSSASVLRVADAAALQLDADAGVWVASLLPQSGSAVAPPQALAVAGAGSAAVANTVAVDVAQDALLVGASTMGSGQLQAVTSLGSAPAAFGAAGKGSGEAAWDAVVTTFPLTTTASQDSLPLLQGLGAFLHSTGGDNSDAANGGTSTPSSDPDAAAGEGFVTGISVGRQTVVSVGFFKGTLHLDGATGNLVETATGVAGSAAGDAYDALLLVNAIGNVQADGSTDGGVVGSLRLGVSSGGASVDDRFRDVAASPDGTTHVFVGHVTSPSVNTAVGLTGAAVTTLPGGGGRDGFVGAMSDSVDGASGLWMEPVGAVSGADDVLTAAAFSAAGDRVAVGGMLDGAAPPSFGLTSVFSGIAAGRKLATVYVLKLNGASAPDEDWGRAFATVEDGDASITTLAWAPATSGSSHLLAIAGTFARGSLKIDDTTTLSPWVDAFPAAPTAFVAVLDADNAGALVWARAARTAAQGSGTTASAMSIARGLSVSAAAVVLAGDFVAPPAVAGTSAGGYLAFDDPATVGDADATKGYPASGTNTAATDAANATVAHRHAFVAVLSLADGTVKRMHVPDCADAGCSAGDVVVSGGRAYVPLTYAGRLVVPTQGTAFVDPRAPRAHRGAMLVLGAGGRGVESVQRLGAPGCGNVIASTAAVYPSGAAVAVGGWRAGAVQFGDAAAQRIPSLSSLEVGLSATAVGARRLSLVTYQPFFGVFDTSPRPVMLPPRGSAARFAVSAVATGSAHAAAVDATLATAAPHSSLALGRHVALTTVNFMNGSVTDTEGYEVHSNGHNSSLDAAILATDRQSGAPLWSWGLQGTTGDFADSITGSCATADGGLVCVAGTVHGGDASAGGATLPALLGRNDVAVSNSGGAGGADAFAACFDGTAGEARDPLWVAGLGSGSEEVATAVARSDDALWVALTTRDTMEFAGVTLTHPTASVLGADAPPRCVLAAFGDGGDAATSVSELHAFAFDAGSGDTFSSCSIDAIAVPRDGGQVYIAGTFTGASLTLPAEGLSPAVVLTPPQNGKLTPFVAAFDTAGAGHGPWVTRWATVGSFDPAAFTPLGDAAASVTGLLLAEPTDGSDRLGRAWLYVAGVFHTETLSFGSSSSNGAVASSGGARVPDVTAGLVDPSAVFVAAFEADAGAVDDGVSDIGAAWLTAVAAQTRDGVAAVGSLALQPGALLSLPVTATAPLLVGPAQPVVGGPAAESSFAAVVQLHTTTGGVAATPVVLSDPLATGMLAGSVHLAAAAGSSAGVAGGVSAGDVVAVGIAHGRIASSGRGLHQDAAPGVQSGAGAHDFVLFHVNLGASGRDATGRGALVANTDGSSVSDASADGGNPFVVLLDVWTSEATAHVVTGGEWRAGAAAGPGLAFTFSSEAVQAQAAAPPRTWVTIESDSVTAVRGSLGHDAFGAVGGDVWLGALRVLRLQATLASGGSDGSTSGAVRWRVRNARVVPSDARCMPCGEVPVATAPPALQHVWDSESAASEVVALASSSGSWPPTAVDASTIVDPACGCLRGVEVVWEERLPSPNGTMAVAADDVVITGVQLGGTAAQGEPGVTSTSVTHGSAAVAPASSTGHLWRSAVATLSLADHSSAADMDWSSITTVRFLTRGAAKSGEVAVRNVVLRRPCALAEALLHPRPVQHNTSVTVQRSGMTLVHAEQYRVITFESNMWGDHSAPTCSAVFSVDGTPPIVSGAAVRDVEPVLGGDIDGVDIEFTEHRTLRVGWSGQFEDPESAPDNILLFRIVNVTHGSPDGPAVPGVESDDELLAVTSTGYVSTSTELPLQDGERYFAHLGVCNRGKMCQTIASTHGVVHDSSPPESALLSIVPNASVSIAAMAAAGEPLPEPATAHHQRDDQELFASWAPFSDPHTWVQELRVGVGTAAFGTDVHELALVANDTTEASFGPKTGETELALGQAYYVVVSAMNAAGAQRFYRTAPLYIDQSAPVAHWVVDVFPRDLPGADSHYETDADVGDVALTDGSTVRAKFHCDDPESVENGVRGNMTYRWRVCNTAACDDAVYADWMDAGETPRGTAPSDVLAAAKAAGTLDWVYVQVVCTNPVGLSSTLSSDGARFDDTPPDNSSAFVADIDPRPNQPRTPTPDADVSWLSTATLRASWAGFSTQVGRPPLLRYEWGVGTAPGLDDVAPFTSVGLATEAETDSSTSSLLHGVTYYVTVAAVTTAGASSTVTSDGVTFDLEGLQLDVADTGLTMLELNDTARCAVHLQCLDLAPGSSNSTLEVDYVASTIALGVTVAHQGLAPLATVDYGTSTCNDGSTDTLFDLNALPLHTAEDPNALPLQFFHDGGLALFHGQRYCTIAFLTSVTGDGAWNVSNGFTVDITPPVPVFIHEGSSSAVDDDAVATSSAVTVTGLCADRESGSHHAMVRVSEVDFNTGDVTAVLADWQVVPESFREPAGATSTPSFTTTITGFNMTQGAWYVTSLRCVNGAGAYSDLDSDGFTLDETAPDGSGVAVVVRLVGTVLGASSQANGTLHASWEGFEDTTSAIVGFSWSVGTSPHGTDVVPLTPVGAATSASISHAEGLQLQDGTTFYVTVYATNEAGLVSGVAAAGVTVDASAPAAPGDIAITELSGSGRSSQALAGWVGASEALRMSWADAVEPHSAVTYRWALGSTPHGQQQVSWTSVGNATQASITGGLALLPGMTYYVSVEAVNAGGSVTLTASQPIGVDPYPPVAGVVADGVAAATQAARRAADDRSQLPQTSAQVATDELYCGWTAFSDSVSGVRSLHVGWGTVPGATDAVAVRTLSPEVHSLNVTGITLTPGTMYHCVVTAYDAAGNAATAISPGTMVDTTAPAGGVVWDLDPEVASVSVGVAGGDIDYLPATRYGPEDAPVIVAAWPGWADPESGVMRIEWAVGTSPGGSDLLPWTHVHSHRGGATWRGAPGSAATVFAAGARIYASVRIENHAGLVTQASSDGLLVLGDAGSAPALAVQAHVLAIVPHALSGNATWCGCGDPAGALAASGAVYDPATGACSCGVDAYLAGTPPAALACVACPAGTCKHVLGNDPGLCTAAACSDGLPDATTPLAPLVEGLASCGTPGSGRVERASDGACVCPAGTRAVVVEATTVCQPCTSGRVNPWMADVPECGMCWEATSPDVVLRVDWNASALHDEGVTPTAVVVSTGTSLGALRWQRQAADGAAPTGSVHFAGREVFTADMLNAKGAGVVPLRQDARLHVRVRAEIDGGASVVADTRVRAPVVDLSPPLAGTVWDGASVGLQDASVLATATTVSAAWFGFADAQCWTAGCDGMAAYWVAFGTQGPGSTDISGGWVAVQEATNAAIQVPGGMAPLADGTTVYASVRGFNTVGGWVEARSNGAVVQTVLPVGAVAVVAASDASSAGVHRHTLSQVHGDSIGAVWQFYDAQTTGAARVPLQYEWAVVDVDASSGSSDEFVLSYTAVGDATWAAATELGEGTLVSGRRYAVRVRASNAAGVTQVTDSPSMLLDASPPSAAVNATPAALPLPAAGGLYRVVAPSSFQASASGMGVAWQCADDVADRLNVTVALGSTVGGDQAAARVQLADIGAGTHEFSGLQLVHGQCYVAHLACTSEAGLMSDYAASAPMCVDTTPPAAVVRAVHPAVEFSGLPLGGTSEPGNVTLGTTSVSALVLAHADTSADEAHLAVAASHLVAWVAAQETASASDSADANVAAPGSLVALARVAVTGLDDESTVRHVTLGWSQSADWSNAGARLDLHGDGGAAASVETEALDLLGRGVVAGGVTYKALADAVVQSGGSLPAVLYPHWSVFNGAASVSTVVPIASAPLTLVPGPPMVSSLTLAPTLAALQTAQGIDGVFHHSDTSSVAAKWQWAPQGATLVGYVWHLVHLPCGRDANGTVPDAAGCAAVQVTPPTWVGSATEVSAAGLSLLAPNGHYEVRVSACDGALQCSTAMATLVVDTSAPTGGMLYLGQPNATLVEVQCTANEGGDCTSGAADATLMVLPAGGLEAVGNVSWGGFVDLDSPIVAYTVALGTSPRGAQLGANPLVMSSGEAKSTLLTDLVSSSDATVQAALYHGATLWASVTAQNAAGLRSTVVEPLLALDHSPLAPSMVTILAATVPGNTPQAAATHSAPHGRVAQNSTSSVSVSWLAFSDLQALGTAAANVNYTAELLRADNLAPVGGEHAVFDAVGEEGPYHAMWQGLALQHGREYTVHVSAADESGNVVTASAIWPLVVDTTPPVQDDSGSQQVLVWDSTTSSAVSSASGGGMDALQDIDCQPRAGVEAADPAEVLTLDARGSSSSSSSGVVVVEEEPLVGTAAGTVYTLGWAPFVDAESGVAHVEVSVGSSLGGTDVVPWTRLSADSKRSGRVQVVLPLREEGSALFGAVRAVNGAGSVSAEAAMSDGVRLLCQAGTVGCDYEGAFLMCFSPQEAEV